MLQLSYLIPSLSFIAISSLSFQSVAAAQESSVCFMVDSSGQATNLETLCQHNSRTEELNQPEDIKLNQKMIADLTQAINTNPNLAEAYVARGYAKKFTGDRQGATEDFQRAVNLYTVRGESQRANIILRTMQKL